MKILLIFSLFVTSTNIMAENWPHWRGPEHNGVSSEKNLPSTWSKSKNVLWRYALPGAGAATPAIWKDRIFVVSAKGKTLVLLCLNTQGKLLWRRTLGTGNRSVFGGEANFASASPTTDGKHVWAFISSGDLACYTVKGDVVWNTNLEKRYGKFKLYFVMSSTPVIDGECIYLQLIHSNAQLVLALDKKNGREVWKHKRKSDARAECLHSYASPFIYRDKKNQYLLIHGADYITAHNLDNGREIWRCGGFHSKYRYNPSLRLVTSPVAIPGLIVAPSAKNGPVFGIKPGAKGDITNSKHMFLWKRPKGTPDVPSPLIHDGLLYLCRENGTLICMEAKSGAEIYKKRVHRSRHRASLVYGDGKLYVTARDGMVKVIKTGRQYKVLASNHIKETITASPAISNSVLYLRSYKALYAIKSK